MILKDTIIEPLADRVIIKRDPEVTLTPGGIIIPDTMTDKPMSGTVLSIGPGRTTESGSLVPMSVKPDDRVLFAKFAGVEIVEDPMGSILLMHERDILGIIHQSTKPTGTIREVLPEGIEQDMKYGMEGVEGVTI